MSSHVQRWSFLDERWNFSKKEEKTSSCLLLMHLWDPLLRWLRIYTSLLYAIICSNDCTHLLYCGFSIKHLNQNHWIICMAEILLTRKYLFVKVDRIWFFFFFSKSDLLYIGRMWSYSVCSERNFKGLHMALKSLFVDDQCIISVLIFLCFL